MKRFLITINRYAKQMLGVSPLVLIYFLEGRWRRFRKKKVKLLELNVLAYVESIAPGRLGGAEISLFNTLRYLAERGHRVRVLTSVKDRNSSAIMGIETALNDCPKRREEWFQWASIVFTQLSWSAEAAKLSLRHGKPWVHFVRATGEAPRFGRPSLIVYNSGPAMRAEKRKHKSILIYPFVDCAQYHADRGDSIVLVNLSEFKGASLFYKLALSLPNKSFLGVKGTAGTQIVPDRLPRNVTILPVTRDMKEVYSKARIILMPSKSESFGRVALEAACSGIPTIGAPVEGLLEVLGASGLFAPRDDLDSWVRLIMSLDNKEAYTRASMYARSRVGCFDPRPQLRGLESRCLSLH